MAATGMKVKMGGPIEDVVDERLTDIETETESDGTDPDEPTSIDDLDPEEFLWEGGPTIGQVQAWKQEFGDVYVTSITLDKHVVWRTLNRFEYKRHVKNMEQLSQNGQLSQSEVSLFNEEAIAEMCILYPNYNRANPTGEMAGTASIISQEVMEASGFVALDVRQL